MKTLTGTVTSTKMKKTVVVTVEKRWRHPMYKKIIKRSKKYFADDQIGVKEKDKVIIQETRPLSKNKNWKVVEKITTKKSKKV